MKVESGKWNVVAISDVAKRVGGGTPSRKVKDYWGKGYPWFTVADLEGGSQIQLLNKSRESVTKDGVANSATNIIPAGAVVFSTRVVVGKIGIAQNEMATNQDFASFIPNEKITTEFLAYALLNTRMKFIDQQRGATIKGITTAAIDRVTIPLPPLPEQKRIVARIQECMGKVQEIEKLRAETETEIKAISASAVNSLDVGKYPHCEVGELIIEMRNGRSIKPTGVNSNGTILTLGAVRSINIDMASQKAIPLDAKTAKDFAFQKDDVFISRANTIDLVGLSGIAMNDSAPWMIYPDLLIKIKVDPIKILPRYLTQALRFPSTREQIRQFAKGTSQSMVKISGAEVRKLKIPLPSLKEQQTLLARIEGIQSVVSKLNVEQKEQNPSLIRESILRKAFAGEL